MFASLFLRALNYEADRPNRRAGEILETLALEPGQTVLDFGSGGGYFSLAFARQVGVSGKVYAADVKPTYLNYVLRRASEAGLVNIAPVLASEKPLPLPEESLDLVFSRSVFHELKDPGECFAELGKYLRPDGRVAIIDYLPGPFWDPISLFRHVSSMEKISRIMGEAGYTPAGAHDFLPSQSFTLWTLAARA